VTPRAYDLYVPAGLKLGLVLLALLTIGAPLMVALVVGGDGGPPRALALLVVVAFVGPWFYVLTVPRRIAVLEGQRIEFASLARRRTILASEIRSIRPSQSQVGFLLVRHSRGKIIIPNQFTGFHVFLAELRKANPAVELLGC
jgi:hypothetical protein